MQSTEHITIESGEDGDLLVWNCEKYKNVRFYQVIKEDDDGIHFMTNVESINDEYDISKWFISAKTEITQINHRIMSKFNGN